jgi:phospholipase D1/2
MRIGSQPEGRQHTGLVVLLSVAGAAIVVAALWRLTPLSEVVDPTALRDRLLTLRDSPWAIPVVWGGFVVGGFLVAPINALFLAVGLAFDLLPAIALSVSGGLLSALTLHEVGRHIDIDRVLHRMPKVRAVKERHLRNAGVVELTLLRFLPLGPFTTMCLLWGAAGVRRGPMLVASALGLLPGAVATALIGQGIGGDSEDHSLGLVAIGCILFSALLLVGKRMLARQPD